MATLAASQCEARVVAPVGPRATAHRRAATMDSPGAHPMDVYVMLQRPRVPRPPVDVPRLLPPYVLRVPPNTCDQPVGLV